MIPKLIARPEAPNLLLFPPGLYPCTLSEMEAALVTSFQTSANRRRILAGLNKYIADLERHHVSGKMWIDGSFVTGKTEPNDVDVVSLVSYEALVSLSPSDQQFLLQNLGAGKGTQDTYLVDSYAVLCVSPSHPLRQKMMEGVKYWREFFGHTRPISSPTGAEIVVGKGLLEISFGDPDEVTTVHKLLSNAIPGGDSQCPTHT